jgi:hypothetical protein
MKEPTLEITDAAFDFWFNDQQHIRSPFPKEIHILLKIKTEVKFEKWLKALDPRSEKEINDEFLAEKLEEILFELALDMVDDDDQKLTILYPFMPRVGDAFNSEEYGPSQVLSRLITKDEKEELSYMQMHLLSEADVKWETKFELPV